MHVSRFLLTIANPISVLYLVPLLSSRQNNLMGELFTIPLLESIKICRNKLYIISIVAQ